MRFGFNITRAQAETVSCLSESFGEVYIDSFGNSGKAGPLLLKSESHDVEVLILVNGDTVRHDYENAVKDAA